MSDNLRERPDEKENDLGFFAADEYPYIRFKNGVKVLKFIVIEQMPVLVARYRDIIFWYGFYKGQWYTDFLNCPEGDDPMLVIEELLEKSRGALHE